MGKKKINWDKQIEYAQKQLDINKAQIEDTNRGTNSFKASTWAIKPKQNRSKIF